MDHFSYFKGKIELIFSLGYSVVDGGYLKGKIESLPNFQQYDQTNNLTYIHNCMKHAYGKKLSSYF